MQERIQFKDVSKELVTPLAATNSYLRKSGLDDRLLDLIEYRVSQINGCVYCLDMHHKDAIHHGETEQRLHSLSAWKESPWFSDAERAVLAYTDSLTIDSDADDDVFNALTAFFTKKEIGELTFAIALTNTWNRLNIAFRRTPGTYQVSQFA